MRIVAIDPGLSNIGVACYDSETGAWEFRVLDSGVRSRTPNKYVAFEQWLTTQCDLALAGAHVIVERQYMTMQLTINLPAIEHMLSLYAITAHAASVTHVYPRTVRKTMGVRPAGTYADRKRRVVEVARRLCPKFAALCDASPASARVHDIADCVLMVLHNLV